MSTDRVIPGFVGGRAALGVCLTVICGVGGLYSSLALSAGEASNVRIKSMAISLNLGNVLYIQASAPPIGTCGSHGYWHFVLSLDSAAGKSMYAMLLSAEAQGTPLHLSGSGTCSSDSVEWLRHATTNFN